MTDTAYGGPIWSMCEGPQPDRKGGKKSDSGTKKPVVSIRDSHNPAFPKMEDKDEPRESSRSV